MKDIFETTGEPCSAGRIADIERSIGRELPAAYRDLTMSTGGGRCRPGVRVRSRNSRIHGRIVTRILGNGVLEDGSDISLDAPATREVAPHFPQHLICALTGSSSEWFIILESRMLFPPAPAGAVCLFDDEHRTVTRVASSFTAFLGKLKADQHDPAVPDCEPALVDTIGRVLADLQVSPDNVQTACDRSMAKTG